MLKKGTLRLSEKSHNQGRKNAQQWQIYQWEECGSDHGDATVRNENRLSQKDRY